ncbi:MAG TPA: MFS transporter [Actinomycetes bacterium]|nr:MFS transporter [Actinomycetes bacterium]
MTPEPTRRRSWLLSGDFGRFWVGQTISNLGSSFTMFALPLLVFNLTGSPINLGITTAAEFVPYLLFGLVIGAWVDRVDRRRLMIATDLARAAVIATIPLLAAFDALSVGWIYAVAFASATLTIAFDAAEFAAIPSLVPSGDDLVTANGRVQASYSTAQIAGPLLAGLLVAVAPVQQVLLVDAASFLVSAVALATIGRAFNAPREEGPRRAIRKDIVDGLRYVLGHPVLRNISAMMALINLVGATVYTQLVVFAKRQLEASDSQVALLYAAGSAGVVLLSLAAGPLRRRLSFSVAALGALALDGLLTVVLAATSWYWAALVLWAAISGLGIFFNINTGSLRQQIVPNHLLGRVISIAGVLAWSAIPVGALAGGWAVERSGSVALVYGVIGALVALLAIAFSFGPLGHADRYLPAGQDAQRS